jgi:NAD(P)-dependent dehydrogenase (short-subunit alcohol dehydrogenase family)
MEVLQGRIAVVTGGASRIGRAMAERFLSEGMSVAIADVESGALRITADALSDSGEVEPFITAVSDPESVDQLARSVTEPFGSFDVVCNNAGVGGHLGRVWETPLADWRWVSSPSARL